MDPSSTFQPSASHAHTHHHHLPFPPTPAPNSHSHSSHPIQLASSHKPFSSHHLNSNLTSTSGSAAGQSLNLTPSSAHSTSNTTTQYHNGGSHPHSNHGGIGASSENSASHHHPSDSHSPSLTIPPSHHRPVSFHAHPSSLPPTPTHPSHQHSSSSLPASNRSHPTSNCSPSSSSPTVTYHQQQQLHQHSHSLLPVAHSHSLLQQSLTQQHHSAQSSSSGSTLHPFHPQSILSDINPSRQPSILHPHALTSTGISNPDHRSNIDNYKSSAKPAYHGFIQTTEDALLIFQACYLKLCPKVTRRLHERERRSISSGSVYVFDEREAGIKRWTDGRVWSPSRILNNFLIYREIDQKRPNSQTNNQTAGPTASSGGNSNNNSNSSNSNHGRSVSGAGNPQHAVGSASSTHINGFREHGPAESKPSIAHSDPPHANSGSPQKETAALTPVQPSPHLKSSDSPLGDVPRAESPKLTRDQERALVGSLTSTYKFKKGGLVKKTISLGGVHMISYYRVNDVMTAKLRTPSSEARILAIGIDARLLNPSWYRVPPIWGYHNDGSIWIQPEGSSDDSGTSNNQNSGPKDGSSSASDSKQDSSQPNLAVALPRISSGSSSILPSSFKGLLAAPSTSVATRTPCGSGPASVPAAEPDSLSRGGPASSPQPGSPSVSHTEPVLSPNSPQFRMSTKPRLDMGDRQASSAGSHGSNVASSQRVSSHSRSATTALASHSHSSNLTAGSHRPSLTGGAPTSSGSGSALRYEPYGRPNRSPPSAVATVSPTSPASNSTPMYYRNSPTAGPGFSPHPFFSDTHHSTASLLNPPPSLGPRHAPGNPAALHQDSSGFDAMSGSVAYGSTSGNVPTKLGGKAGEFGRGRPQYGSKPDHSQPGGKTGKGRAEEPGGLEPLISPLGLPSCGRETQASDGESSALADNHASNQGLEYSDSPRLPSHYSQPSYHQYPVKNSDRDREGVGDIKGCSDGSVQTSDYINSFSQPSAPPPPLSPTGSPSLFYTSSSSSTFPFSSNSDFRDSWSLFDSKNGRRPYGYN